MSQIIGLPVSEKEAYVSRKQLAALMGVSLRTVDKLTAQGMPSVTFGLRTRRYLPSRALAWARQRDSRRAA